ncbi:hypothetical protein F4780DRAFT_500633 [Xylariomycetidae sp. FL0641]|nr:hypothetical protein F4780DRAFT_500633 [Xylariomycetidae sp. FL0641]
MLIHPELSVNLSQLWHRLIHLSVLLDCDTHCSRLTRGLRGLDSGQLQTGYPDHSSHWYSSGVHKVTRRRKVPQPTRDITRSSFNDALHTPRPATLAITQHSPGCLLLPRLLVDKPKELLGTCFTGKQEALLRISGFERIGTRSLLSRARVTMVSPTWYCCKQLIVSRQRGLAFTVPRRRCESEVDCWQAHELMQGSLSCPKTPCCHTPLFGESCSFRT